MSSALKCKLKISKYRSNLRNDRRNDRRNSGDTLQQKEKKKRKQKKEEKEKKRKGREERGETEETVPSFSFFSVKFRCFKFSSVVFLWLIWQYYDHHMRIWWWWWHIAKIISLQQIFGLYGLQPHIVEINGDVTDARRRRTREDRASQPMDCWRLSLAIITHFV